MAKLFAATIDEKELEKKAQEVWRELNRHEGSYGFRTDSQIEKYIREKILDRLYEKIKEILQEPISEEILEKKAREMLEKARQVGEETIIRNMASHLANTTLSAYNYRERLVDEILQEINLRTENNRHY